MSDEISPVNDEFQKPMQASPSIGSSLGETAMHLLAQLLFPFLRREATEHRQEVQQGRGHQHEALQHLAAPEHNQPPGRNDEVLEAQR